MPAKNGCGRNVLAEEASAKGQHRLPAEGAGQLDRSRQRDRTGGQIADKHFYDAELHDQAHKNL